MTAFQSLRARHALRYSLLAMPTVFTLLFTDIEGSTALNTRLGDAAMATVWAQHDRASRDLLLQWRGREIDRSDGFLALFDAPTDAAAFALAYHQMLAQLPLPLKARAGLHTSPLDLRHNGPADVALGAKALELVGIGKAVGARLMGLAQGGQTLCSAASASALMQAGWRCCRHGHWRMKGLAEPLEVHEVGDDSTPFTPPPDAEKAQRVLWHNGQWVSGEQVPHNLPAERDSFVGRAQDLQGLAERFDGDARLVTLHGPGGMGKTRLALRYAWAWRGSFPGGLWFCDLAQARSLDGVLQAVASGLDVPLGKDPVVQLGRAIAGRGHCLVILDNFEQVAGHASETLGHWLDAAPAACFVVSSREVLGLVGEQTLGLEALQEADAAALFHQRALAARADYAPTLADRALVHQLVNLLDGLPLAIELAAPRIRAMTPQQLLARMDQRFRLLAARSGRPERHATLQATLDWSWDLLSHSEQCTLAQLSVFDGGFDGPAAQAVVTLEADALATWLPDVLQALIEKSLLRGLAGQRFGLMRSVQDFAAARLLQWPANSPQAQAARRHCTYFAALDEGAAVAHRCIELDNLVRACRSAVAAGQADEASACLALAWAALRLTGPFRVAVNLADEVRAMPTLKGRASATADWVAGAALWTLGDYVQSQQVLERGLRALPQPHDVLLSARLQVALADVAAARGEHALAQGFLDEACRLAQQTGHAPTLCRSLNANGSLAEQQGRLDEARQHYEAALHIATLAGDAHWCGGLLGNLGALHFAQGRLPQAQAAYEQALALAERIADRRWAGNALCNLGLIHHEFGRSEEAEAALNQSLESARVMGHRHLEYTVQCNLGLVLEARGELAAACEKYATAVAGARALGAARSESQFRCCLGLALARTGQFVAASECLQRALTMSHHSDDKLNESLALCALAEVEHLRGERNSAHAHWLAAGKVASTSKLESLPELARRLATVGALLA